MKLFLAGADEGGKIEIIRNSNHPYFLSSYYVHRKKFNPKWLKWYNKTKHGDWIMDSGLFTMMFGAGKHKTYTEEDLLKYTHKYLKDLKSINYNHYIVEMDVHKVLGLNSLKRFRNIFKENYPIEKTIYVWHIEEGKKGFVKLCKTYPYIAISIPELRIVLKGKGSLNNAVISLIKEANKINPKIKIHLLGCTQQNLMEQKGYYSCDSTSWFSSARFGTASIFNGFKLQQIKISNKQYQNYIKLKRDEYINAREELLDTEYNFNMFFGAKAYSCLNTYINNKHYNYEPIKNIL